jgi:hypothetical protein
LVRSLGGVVRRSEKMGAYGGKECRRVYRLFICLPRDVSPFRLPAKANRYHPAWGSKNRDRGLRRFIRSVEPVGRGLATCISVAHPSKLFVTKDHIVTHNTTLVSWIIYWFMSTRPSPQVVVTANTNAQLTGKTWRELAKWHRLAKNASWFAWSAQKFSLKAAPDTWFASAVPWSKERAEAFAGTHEKHVLVIFDEASAIDDVIWEVAEGAMTTSGAMWFAFGNGTRNTGRFRECFRRFKHRWVTRTVDSRTAKKADQKQIAQWAEDYGEDSDFFRVRVRGDFPRAANSQFIPEDIVEDAMARYRGIIRRKRQALGELAEQGAVARVSLDEDAPKWAPLILSVDVARFGGDESILGFRRGNLFLVHSRHRGQDLQMLAAKVAEAINAFGPDATFVDAVGVGGGVVDALTHLGYRVESAMGSMKALDETKYFNRRVEMWALMREWIKNGGVLEDSTEIRDELIGPEYGFDGKSRWQLETKEDMKARGLPSPNIADCLAMSFFMPVAPRATGTDVAVARFLANQMAGTSHMAH